MIEPKEYDPKDFETLLANFKEPTKALKTGGRMIKPYVAFAQYLKQSRKDPVTGNRTYERVPSLFVLDMSGAHAQASQVQYYAMTKGYKVVKWHLPFSGKEPGEGLTPFSELEHMCRMLAAAGSTADAIKRANEAEARASALEKEVEAQKAKIAESEKAKKVKE